MRQSNWVNQLPTDKDRQQALRTIGRKLFSTPDGSIFLAMMLDDLHFTTATRHEADETLRSYAHFFLKERLGLTNDSLAVTSALLNIGQEE